MVNTLKHAPLRGFANAANQSRRAFIFRLVLVLVPAALGPAFEPASSHAQQVSICGGLLTYDRMQGTDTIYKGTGVGSAWLVDTDGRGNVVTRLQVTITPGVAYVVKSHQTWSC